MTLKTITSPAAPDPSPYPTTTKAWTFTSRGAPSDVLTITPDHPLPSFPPPPTSKDFAEETLLVRISHASLNPGSLFHLRLLPAAARASPSVPGCDFSGTVIAVHSPPKKDESETEGDATSATVPRFRPGARVVGFVPVGYGFPTGTGSLAQNIVIPAKYAVRLPDEVSMVDAGGLMINALTGLMAVDAARKDGGLARGKRVLVVAAAGGIGSLVLQMVRDIVHGVGNFGFQSEEMNAMEGAEDAVAKPNEGLVVAIASTRNIDLVKSLGADEVLDHTQYPGPALTAELTRRHGLTPTSDLRFDAVIDCCGLQPLYASCAGFTKENSPWASVGVKLSSWTYGAMLPVLWHLQMNNWWPVNTWLGGTGRVWRGVTMMAASVGEMERVVKMMEGGMRIVKEEVRNFEDVKEAYDLLERGGMKGKIIIKVGEDEQE